MSKPDANRVVVELLDDSDDNDDEKNQSGPASASNDNNNQPIVIPHSSNGTEAHACTHDNSAHERPILVALPPNFKPTWRSMLPIEETIMEQAPKQPPTKQSEQSFFYHLSLLSKTEFSLTSDQYDNVTRLRKSIKQIVRRHGNNDDKAKAKYENYQDPESGIEVGRWRIPLSVYHRFITFLKSDSRNNITEIPQWQLNIASLGRATSERQYSSPETLIQAGIPSGIANSLALFQRGGVDFCLSRHGRALIADEMGLGKTIQSIAAMSCYHDEWPLLIFTPSSARYNWQYELLHWLGEDSPVNLPTNTNNSQNCTIIDDSKIYQTSQNDDGSFNRPTKQQRTDTNNDSKDLNTPPNQFKYLRKSDINVLTKSQDNIFPNENTRIVICSYGLGTNLITSNQLIPGMFKCVIVDESQFLKNINSKRTKSILPILYEAERVIMLSGTPAFAKPIELFPQLSVLGSHNGWWKNYQDFIQRYCVKNNTNNNTTKGDNNGDNEENSRGKNLQELHVLLTSTVMIRRTKDEILKSLPAKIRESVFVNVRDSQLQIQITDCMNQLRAGNGELMKLEGKNNQPSSNSSNHGVGNITTVTTYSSTTHYGDNEAKSYKNALSQAFSLTGEAKIPIIAEMLKEWLKDKTLGKLCIFAHHTSVLDGIIALSGLSKSTYMRIDGSTNPKLRQEYIQNFQTDASIRVAMLGITAAGVAVTLTASSTVWFAELFWTPAIMLQAEDRCHRIGQQTNVNCVYVIARGTIDDILWLLIKKKFRDLGEFVEGEANLDLNTNRHYESEFDYLNHKLGSNIDDDRFDSQRCSSLEDLVQLDSIQRNILDFAAEESTMLTILDEDEDVQKDELRGNENKANPSRLPSRVDAGTEATINGHSQENAICLVDDGDDNIESEENFDDKELTLLEIFNQYEKTKNTTLIMDIPGSVRLKNFHIYSTSFNGPKYGFVVLQYNTRYVVMKNTEMKIRSEPNVGDILLSIQGYAIGHGYDFKNLVNAMTEALKKPPVQLLFGRDSDFSKLFVNVVIPVVNSRMSKKIS